MKKPKKYLLSARTWLGISAIWLAGCSTIPPGSCEYFESLHRSMRYDTVYRYSANDTRNAGRAFTANNQNEPVAARWYTLRTNRPQISACDHLYLAKELYFYRAKDASVTVEELREIYTAHDRLIASKREDLTSQLKATGFYTASVPFPIPPEAPGGTYKIVSRLIAKTKGKERTLATTSVEFRVER